MTDSFSRAPLLAAPPLMWDHALLRRPPPQRRFRTWQRAVARDLLPTQAPRAALLEAQLSWVEATLAVHLLDWHHAHTFPVGTPSPPPFEPDSVLQDACLRVGRMPVVVYGGDWERRWGTSVWTDGLHLWVAHGLLTQTRPPETCATEGGAHDEKPLGRWGLEWVRAAVEPPVDPSTLPVLPPALSLLLLAVAHAGDRADVPDHVGPLRLSARDRALCGPFRPWACVQKDLRALPNGPDWLAGLPERSMGTADVSVFWATGFLPDVSFETALSEGHPLSPFTWGDPLAPWLAFSTRAREHGFDAIRAPALTHLASLPAHDDHAHTSLPVLALGLTLEAGLLRTHPLSGYNQAADHQQRLAQRETPHAAWALHRAHRAPFDWFGLGGADIRTLALATFALLESPHPTASPWWPRWLNAQLEKGLIVPSYGLSEREVLAGEAKKQRAVARWLRLADDDPTWSSKDDLWGYTRRCGSWPRWATLVDAAARQGTGPLVVKAWPDLLFRVCRLGHPATLRMAQAIHAWGARWMPPSLPPAPLPFEGVRRPDVARWVMGQGHDPARRDGRGDNAVDHLVNPWPSSVSGTASTLRCLVEEAGCSPNAVDGAGNTALHKTMKGKLGMPHAHRWMLQKCRPAIRILLRLGANPVARNHQGKSVIEAIVEGVRDPEAIEDFLTFWRRQPEVRAAQTWDAFAADVRVTLTGAARELLGSRWWGHQEALHLRRFLNLRPSRKTSLRTRL